MTAAEEEQLRRLAASWRTASSRWATHIIKSPRAKAFRECADQLAATLDDMDF